MKRKFLFAAFLGLAMIACTSNEVAPSDSETSPEKAKSAKSLLPSKAQVDSVSYLVGINFGSFIKGNNFGEDLNFSQIQKGINDFLKTEGDPRDPEFAEKFKINLNDMGAIFNRFLQQKLEYTTVVNKEKSEAFLAKNKKEKGVMVTESGLQYIVVEPGNEMKATSLQDTVVVRYKGTLLDGTVFDQTSEDADPISFPLDRVIKGWGEGLQLVGEGGKLKLFIPSELAYGENGTRGIEPNSALIFDVELIAVHPVVVKETEE